MPELDPVIHAQARLRIVSALATLDPDEAITFPRLQELLDMTAGNLSTHLRKLEEPGYVDVSKTHEARTPVTYIALSRQGRRAFEDYTEALRDLLDGSSR
jgi:DNA-binding MarR family transcriptional regulator